MYNLLLPPGIEVLTFLASVTCLLCQRQAHEKRYVQKIHKNLNEITSLLLIVNEFKNVQFSFSWQDRVI